MIDGYYPINNVIFFEKNNINLLTSEINKVKMYGLA